MLDLPGLPDQLLTALNTWSPMRNIIVVGGGQAADLIREWDKHWQLGEHRSHRLAIFAMTWNARHLFGNRTEFQLAAQPSVIAESTKPCVILTEPFLNSVVLNGTEDCLPESWQITSDSICAYVAKIVKADQLVLLKSTDCGQGEQSPQPVESVAEELDADRFRLVEISEESTLKNLANHNQVDPCFPQYASAVSKVFWCNFRGRHQQGSRIPAD